MYVISSHIASVAIDSRACISEALKADGSRPESWSLLGDLYMLQANPDMYHPFRTCCTLLAFVETKCRSFSKTLCFAHPFMAVTGGEDHALPDTSMLFQSAARAFERAYTLFANQHHISLQPVGVGASSATEATAQHPSEIFATFQNMGRKYGKVNGCSIVPVSVPWQTYSDLMRVPTEWVAARCLIVRHGCCCVLCVCLSRDVYCTGRGSGSGVKQSVSEGGAGV